MPADKLLVDVLNTSPFKLDNNVPAMSVLDIDLNLFHPTVPMMAIINKSFYIKVYETLYYVANN